MTRLSPLQTIREGQCDTRPARNTIARVSYKLFLVDSSTGESRLIESVDDESFFVGEHEILPAIDICVQLMDRGEHALIDADVRHCYGDIGCPEKKIPASSSTGPYRMKIDVELHDWKVSSDVETLAAAERLSWGFDRCFLSFLSVDERVFVETRSDRWATSTTVDKIIPVLFNAIAMPFVSWTSVKVL